MLRSGVRPASRANRVLNYVLSCVLANSKLSLLRLRQTRENSFSPACVPHPAPTVSSTMSSACPLLYCSYSRVAPWESLLLYGLLDGLPMVFLQRACSK